MKNAYVRAAQRTGLKRDRVKNETDEQVTWLNRWKPRSTVQIRHDRACKKEKKNGIVNEKLEQTTLEMIASGPFFLSSKKRNFIRPRRANKFYLLIKNCPLEIKKQREEVFLRNYFFESSFARNDYFCYEN